MLRRLLTFFFLLFVFASTFSISLSQSALGIAAVLFVIAAVSERFNPFGGGLQWFWAAVAIYIGWLVLVCLLQGEPLRALDNIREEWLFAVIPIGIYLGRDTTFPDRAMKVLALGLLLVSLAALIMAGFGVQYSWPDGFTPLLETNPRVRGTFAHALTFGNVAAIASLCVLAWAFLQRTPVTPRARSAAGGPSSADSDDSTTPPSMSGARQMPSSAGFLRRPLLSWQTLALLASILGLIAVLLCGGRGPMLAALVGLVVLPSIMPRPWRRLGWAVLLVVLAIGVLTPTVRSRFSVELGWHFNRDWPGGRLFIWERSLDIAIAHPLTGVGPGNFGREYHERLDTSVSDRFWYQHAHNDFLEAACRSGIPGAATFALLWVSALRSLWRGRRHWGEGSRQRRSLAVALVGSLVFFVESLSEATFSDEEVRVLLMLVWALGLAAVYNREKSSAQGQPYVY
ncbi:MAG: O-antigen ligase family protein [Candidatus Zixiibacteriota bacterium]